MKKRIAAGILGMLVGFGLSGDFHTIVFAGTAIVEEDMENGTGDMDLEDNNWQMYQEVDTKSCRQGEDVTLRAFLTGNAEFMQVSTIYARLQYDPDLFEIRERDISSVKSGSADNVSFDPDSGEIDIYYAEDIRVEAGAEILKITLHILSDADVGDAKIGIDLMEIYASESTDYAVMENGDIINVSIKERSRETVLLGDVNQDKKISLMDVKLIMKYCTGGTKLTAAQKKNADVNKDGKVNLTDAKLVMKYCNGEIKKFK